MRSGSARYPALMAMFWMAGTLVSFAAMAVGAREASRELHTFQILFFRSLIGLAIMSAVLGHHGWRHVATRRLGTHLLRNGAHFGGQFGWVYGIASIPLAQVFAIEFTFPIWTALLAAILLRERLTRPRLVAIGLGVAGILLILRPGAVPVSAGALAVLLGAAAYGLSHTLTKRLVENDSPLAILFYMTVLQLPLGLIPSLTHWVTPSAALWPWLLAIGLSALTGHYCMARALALADAMVVVPLDFLRLPLIIWVGHAYYHERTEGFVVAGAALMLAGNLWSIRAEQRQPLRTGAPIRQAAPLE